MTQDQLATRSGLCSNTVHRLERGVFTPGLDTLIKLCRGFQIPLSRLFESFELNEVDASRELLDLLATRTPHEIELAFNVLRVVFGYLDETADQDAREPAA